MKIESKRFTSSLWQGVTDPKAKRAIQDIAEKMEQLARAAESRVSGLDAVPSGTVVFWLGAASTIPEGWSEVVELRGRFPRGMDVSGTPGTPGGADTHSHTMTHNHGGTSDSIPNHTHGISSDTHSHTVTGSVSGFQSYTGSGSNFFAAHDGSGTTGYSHSHGGSTGVGGGHQHTLSINNYTGSTGAASLLPSYLDGLWIRKD